MAILKNKTQGNFTQVSNKIFNDSTISMKDKGIYCTLCSRQDGWEFSVEGLASLCTDGKDSIRNSIYNLEERGYITRTKTRDGNGKFTSIIEIHTEAVPTKDVPSRETRHGESVTDFPSRDDRSGSAVTDKPSQNNNKNTNNEYSISINQSEMYPADGEIDAYRKIIAQNIDLDNLLEMAKNEPGNKAETVQNIYDTLCDAVCFPRKTVRIRNIEYPWDLVRSRLLKLKKESIVSVLSRLSNQYYAKSNKYGFLISTLFTESLTSSINSQPGTSSDTPRDLKSKDDCLGKGSANLPPKQNKFDYSQRCYSDEEMKTFEMKKLGIT